MLPLLAKPFPCFFHTFLDRLLNFPHVFLHLRLLVLPGSFGLIPHVLKDWTRMVSLVAEFRLLEAPQFLWTAISCSFLTLLEHHFAFRHVSSLQAFNFSLVGGHAGWWQGGVVLFNARHKLVLARQHAGAVKIRHCHALDLLDHTFLEIFGKSAMMVSMMMWSVMFSTMTMMPALLAFFLVAGHLVFVASQLVLTTFCCFQAFFKLRLAFTWSCWFGPLVLIVSSKGLTLVVLNGLPALALFLVALKHLLTSTVRAIPALLKFHHALHALLWPAAFAGIASY